MRRRTALFSVPLVAALLLPGVQATAATGTGGIPAEQARIFAEDSFWYRELPDETPAAPNSSAIVADLVQQAEDHYGRPGFPNIAINAVEYTPTIYVADEADPVVEVRFDNCQRKPANDWYVQRMFTGPGAPMKAVRIPADAVPARGTDAEMVVIDSVGDRLVELWQAKRRPDGTLSACWGVVQDNASQSSGTFERPFGVTAAGLSMLGGTILAEELAAGEIDHVIGMALPFSAPWPTVSAPANRTDGRNPQGVNVPAQGQLLRLPADLDLAALRLPPAVHTIAEAAQDHGIIIWDTAGAVSLRSENTLSIGSDPYKQIFGGQMSMVLMQRFPLDKLEVLPMNYEAPVNVDAPPEQPIQEPVAPTPQQPTEQPAEPAEESTGQPAARVRAHWNNGWTSAAERTTDIPGAKAGDQFLSGDWDGDGVDSPGVRRDNKIMLWNGDGSGAPDVTYWYGTAQDEAFVGDWDGDGKDSLGIRRGNVVHLRNSLTSGNAETTVAYGRIDDELLIGDWDGDGGDTFAVRRGNEIHVVNSLRGGLADARFWYGRAEDGLATGDFDGDGKDTFVVRRGSEWHVRNALTSGNADQHAVFGRPDDAAIVGDWDRDGKDTVALLRVTR